LENSLVDAQKAANFITIILRMFQTEKTTYSTPNDNQVKGVVASLFSNSENKVSW